MKKSIGSSLNKSNIVLTDNSTSLLNVDAYARLLMFVDIGAIDVAERMAYIGAISGLTHLTPVAHDRSADYQTAINDAVSNNRFWHDPLLKPKLDDPVPANAVNNISKIAIDMDSNSSWVAYKILKSYNSDGGSDFEPISPADLPADAPYEIPPDGIFNNNIFYVPVPQPNGAFVCTDLVIAKRITSGVTKYYYGEDSEYFKSQLVNIGTDGGIVKDPIVIGYANKIYYENLIYIEVLDEDEDKVKSILPSVVIPLAKTTSSGAGVHKPTPSIPQITRSSEHPSSDHELLPRREPSQVLSWNPELSDFSAQASLFARPNIYYSGADCQIFIDGKWFDQASAFSHSISDSTTPIYGYTNSLFNYLTIGKKYIAGVIKFPLVGPNTVQGFANRSLYNHISIDGIDIPDLERLLQYSPREVISILRNYSFRIKDTRQYADGVEQLEVAQNARNKSLEAQRQLDTIFKTVSNVYKNFPQATVSLKNNSMGYLNPIRIDRITVMVGLADETSVDFPEQVLMLEYGKCWITDYAVNLTADARAVEIQFNFIASRYREREINESDSDMFPPETHSLIESYQEVPELVVPRGSSSSIASKFDHPISSSQAKVLQSAEAIVPCEDAPAGNTSNIAEADFTGETLSAILDNFPNVTYYTRTVTIPDAFTIGPTNPLALILKENDFDKISIDNKKLLYACLLSLIKQESSFVVDAVTSVYNNTLQEIRFFMRTTNAKPMEGLSGISGRFRRTRRELISAFTAVNFNFIKATGEGGLRFNESTKYVNAAHEMSKAYGPLQLLGFLLPIYSNDSLASSFLFYHNSFSPYTSANRTFFKFSDGNPGIDISTFTTGNLRKILATSLYHVFYSWKDNGVLVGSSYAISEKNKIITTVNLAPIQMAIFPIVHYNGNGNLGSGTSVKKLTNKTDLGEMIDSDFGTGNKFIEFKQKWVNYAYYTNYLTDALNIYNEYSADLENALT